MMYNKWLFGVAFFEPSTTLIEERAKAKLCWINQEALKKYICQSLLPYQTNHSLSMYSTNSHLTSSYAFFISILKRILRFPCFLSLWLRWIISWLEIEHLLFSFHWQRLLETPCWQSITQLFLLFLEHLQDNFINTIYEICFPGVDLMLKVVRRWTGVIVKILGFGIPYNSYWIPRSTMNPINRYIVFKCESCIWYFIVLNPMI